MKTSEFKQLIKECIEEVMNEFDGHEPYDPETDTMVPAPRDRTEPSRSGGEDKLSQAIYKLNLTAFLLRTLSKACEQRGLPNLAKKANDAYYDIIKFTKSGIKEDSDNKQSIEQTPAKEPSVDKTKIKLVNNILVTCGDIQKRIHSLTDRVIVNGIRNIQDTCIELMKSLGAK